MINADIIYDDLHKYRCGTLTAAQVKRRLAVHGWSTDLRKWRDDKIEIMDNALEDSFWITIRVFNKKRI